MSGEAPPKGTGRGPWRGRFLVLLLGLSPFVLLEAGLWIAGYGGKSHVSFAPQVSVFYVDGETVRVKPAHVPQFRTRPFARHKAAGVRRVFVVGDSVTWGWEPRSPEVRVDPAYPEQLQGLLEGALGAGKVEVLNVGGVCHATHRLVHVLEEVLRFEPDLLVVMAGHSEFIEARFFQQRARLERARLSWVRYWKTLLLAQNLVRRLQAATPRTPEGAVTGLDLPLVAADRVRGAAEVERMLAGSKKNLARMVGAAERAGVPLLLVTQPSNLRQPPNARDEALQRQNEALNFVFPEVVIPAREALAAGEPARALELLDRGVARLRRDPAHRDDWRLSVLQHGRGEALLALGRDDEARRAFVRAKDLEGLPSRVLSAFNAAVKALAAQPGVTVVDGERAFEARAPHGIPGPGLFFDDCHPNLGGHHILARAIFEQIQKHQLLAR